MPRIGVLTAEEIDARIAADLVAAHAALPTVHQDAPVVIHAALPDEHHTAPAYDAENKEVLFQLGAGES